MPRPALEKAIAGALRAGRPGISVFEVELPEWPASKLVPHSKACMTTPAIVRNGGIEIEHTRDQGHPQHHTIWLPDDVKWDLEEVDDIGATLRALFLGPVSVEEVDDEWDTDRIRGLSPPTPDGP